MGLHIFDTDDGEAPRKRQSFADDVVGRLRSGYQVNGRPAALEAWRVTTGDPDVASAVAELYGGDPQEWDASGEDGIEVFTEATSVDVIVDGAPDSNGNPRGLRQRLILWGRNGGKPIYTSDGVTKDDGSPDPDAGLTLAERKEKARQGIGPVPAIEVYVRLADNPDLGLFKFASGSWSFASDLDYNDTEADLLAIGGPVKATLSLEGVSFVAKSGKRAGKTVSYTKPVLKIKGAA